MIKAEDKGEKIYVSVNGNGLQLISEFSAIVASLADNCSTFILKIAFEHGLSKKGEGKSDGAGSEAAEDLLKEILGEGDK